jgi:cytochrome P450
MLAQRAATSDWAWAAQWACNYSQWVPQLAVPLDNHLVVRSSALQIPDWQSALNDDSISKKLDISSDRILYLTIVSHTSVDLFSAQNIADPYPAVAELRDTDPVHWHEQWGGWILTRHDDVVAALRNVEALKSDRMGNYVAKRERLGRAVGSGEVTREILARWLSFSDPPVHTRLRLLVNKAFTPKTVGLLEGRINEICCDLLDDIADRGEFDLIADYTYLLPVTIIAEMLGVPASDHELIKKWSQDIMLIVFMALGATDRHERAESGLSEMVSYLRTIIEKRRNDPQDDLISYLIRAEEEGDRLSIDEVVATCTVLLFGGHETTTHLIANAMLALLQNPSEKARLTAQPDLMPLAVEEFLRYDGPVRGFLRWAATPVHIREKEIAAGDRVLILVDGANRDPAVFDQPDRLDISRNPNRHVEFGYGIHHCLGAPLARIETPIAVRLLLERFPSLHRLNDGPADWNATLLSRSMKTFPVAV